MYIFSVGEKYNGCVDGAMNSNKKSESRVGIPIEFRYIHPRANILVKDIDAALYLHRLCAKQQDRPGSSALIGNQSKTSLN